ncbi:histone deacetylase [Streptomyces spongiicola]|uniref:Histone deacetylase n=1 Tax=Streptomyces spongiicola TaxID=1690221 RepID=A0ABN5KQW8_9ACTN|nr:histone deacetylase [Streptomyces spongiicola]AWK09487.1 histone deacetylase [Streptomyces spongiicola]
MKRARTVDAAAAPSAGHPPAVVWYTAYGSNTHPERLSHYLAGGRPRGAARTYPGCRDPRPPAASVPVEVPGALYFATRSPVWRGGRAFYDPAAAGTVLARAYLVTAAQFSDILAQEMYREPGADLDLSEALARGRVELGSGRYETLVCPGVLDGVPVLTFTAPCSLHDVEWTRPSAAYLRHLAAGLLDADAWPAPEIAAYLAACPGAAGHWTADAVAALTAGR